MKSTLSAKRKSDALITIRQNNSDHLVQILNMNRSAEKLTGYNVREIAGSNFDDLLTDRVSESLHDYIEFDDPNNDFAAVARKIPNFQIKTKQGKDIPVSMKIFYLASTDSNMQEYELLLNDMSLIRKIEELKNKIISDNDPKAITDVKGLMSAYNTVYDFIETDPIDVTLVTFGVDNYKSYLAHYNENELNEIFNKFAKFIKETCRDQDVVAYIENGIIAVILIDCSSQNALDVINRVIKANVNESSKIKMFDGRNFKPTLSVSYTQLDSAYNPSDVFDACMENTLNIQENGGHSISEL